MTLDRRDFISGCGCMIASSLLPGAGAIGAGVMTFDNKICAFGDSVIGSVTNVGEPASEAVAMLEMMTDLVGIRQNIVILAADIERYAKAFATIKKGQRYIVYNRSNFDWKGGQLSWDDVSTVGHELGHHIASHVFADEYSQHEQELEADRFSGFAMYHIGATLSQATAEFSDWPATSSHPGGLRRKKAVADGWQHAEKLATKNDNQCKPKFTGQSIDIDGTLCRMVRRCEGTTPATELACQDYDGAWRWKR